MFIENEIIEEYVFTIFICSILSFIFLILSLIDKICFIIVLYLMFSIIECIFKILSELIF